MLIKINKNYFPVIILTLIAFCESALATDLVASSKINYSLIIKKADEDICPIPEFKPDKITIENETPEPDAPATPLVDDNRNIKDFGTDFVVNKFFTTPDTLFNFMKIVYGNIDSAIKQYVEKNNLSENSISLLFKGGNVLRMVANRAFDLFPPKARNLLKSEYDQYIKRSDADFTVYVDEEKIGDLAYESVMDEVAKLVLEQLNLLRTEFSANPEKYFNFLQLKSSFAGQELGKYFNNLPALDAVNDPKNNLWYQSKFLQMQLLDERANAKRNCSYDGGFDYRFENNQDGNIVGTPLNNKPNWIINTDNRTLESPMEIDPNKLISFFLVRSKVAFEYTYEKDGVIKRKSIGGELIDVSLPTKRDHNLRTFLDSYDHAVATYTLFSPQLNEQIDIKAYSISELVEDLKYIILNRYIRPWDGGPKYSKRINRLFFLYALELFSNYDLGSDRAKSYIYYLKQNVLRPMHDLYPIASNSEVLTQKIAQNIKKLVLGFPEIKEANIFWQQLGEFLSQRLIAKTKPEDAEEWKIFLEIIEKNIKIAESLANMEYTPIDLSEIYKIQMKHLF